MIALFRLAVVVAYVLTLAVIAGGAEYPVAYLTHPRDPNQSKAFDTMSVSEADGMRDYHAGTDLVIRHIDGTDEVLVDGDKAGFHAVQDFCVSLDGQSIFYSHIADDETCDLYKLDLNTNTSTKLTDSGNEWAGLPNAPVRPVWNVSPCECADGTIVFTSDRDGVRSPKEGHRGGFSTFQLYRMDGDGKHVRKIGHLNLGGAAHPTLGPNGRVYFSTGEQQGLRSGQGNHWVIWSINPDGSDWQPEHTMAGFRSMNPKDPCHFQTHTSDGTLVFAQYYDTRIYGTFRAAPVFVPDPFGNSGTIFDHPLRYENPLVRNGNSRNGNAPAHTRYGFQRKGMYSPTHWTGDQDRTQKGPGEQLVGMVAHPQGAPGNELLLTWTGDQGAKLMTLGVFKIPDASVPLELPSELIPVVSIPGSHCWMGAPVVSWQERFGVASPPRPSGVRSTLLPAGSPFGVIGSSSVHINEITEQETRDPSTGQRGILLDIDPDDIEHIRIIAFNPTNDFTGAGLFETTSNGDRDRWDNDEGFYSMINERAGIFGDVPVKHWRKPDGTVHSGPNPPSGSTRILRSDGTPDSSWRAIVPANTPWTFQLIDPEGKAIPWATAQTWHQVIPGERRTNCQGCHAHHEPDPIDFDDTLAGSIEYVPQKLSQYQTVEFQRDIKPILDAKGLDWGPEPWKTAAEAYSSGEQINVDLGPLSDPEKRLVYRWIDTGLMAAGHHRSGPMIQPHENAGPYADALPPTVTAHFTSGTIRIGAFDAQSGVASVSVKSDAVIEGRPGGTELWDLFASVGEHIWELSSTVPSGSLFVTVTDNGGAVTSESYPMKANGTTPPTCEEELEQARQTIEDLLNQIDSMQQEIDGLRETNVELQGRIDEAISVLETAP